MARPQRLFIIDAMALAFRSFYALGRSSLSTSQGIPTGAIFGTAMFLNKVIAEQHPDYLVAVTDAPGETFRHELYKDYKATRDRMPEDLAKQIPFIMELFGAFQMRLLQVPGVEADDVIATLAMRYAGPELTACIVSGDKDFMQLIGDHVFMFASKKNEEILVIDRAAVREKFSCTPEQIVDVLALMGDAVDNVPGVRGIGEKGAAKLIETYGSLEGIYAHLGEITAKKQREGLETCRDDAFLSRQLVTLKTDLPLPVDLAALACVPATAAANEALFEFYTRFELKTLAKKVGAVLGNRAKAAGSAPATPPSADPVVEMGVVYDDAPVTEVTTQATQQALRDALAASGSVALMVVASGTDIIADKAVALALAVGSERFLVPLSEEGIYLVRPLLADAAKRKIGHNLKTAMQMLLNVGIDVGGPTTDLEICDYLLDPNNYNHTLAALPPRHLGADRPLTTAASQAAALLELDLAIAPKLAAFGLERVLREAEMPLVPVLAAMEREGVYVDPDVLGVISDELAETGALLEKQLYAAAGREFNVGSPKQLQELLFDELKLHEAAGMKRLKKTKTGFSTDESVLSRLAQHHAVPRLILEYRAVTKLKNTYVDPLPQYINSRTGRVHTSFRQTVAATGRLSSDRPNLQNIPMRSAMGRRVRAAFCAQDSGHVLISADYSQIELRLLAHLAQAEGLLDAFARGLDIHTVTAAKIFSVAEDAVTPALRSRAKAVNFGIIYGMGPQRLAAETGVTLAEAKEFIRRYFEVYPGIKTYTEGLIETARATGYCTTILGRRRPVPEMRDPSQVMMARGENIAVNAPLQGSAADLVKLAMIRVAAVLRQKRSKTRLQLQIHDELVLAAPLSEVHEIMPLIKHEMEQALQTSVPLKVDIHSGRNWLEAH